MEFPDYFAAFVDLHCTTNDFYIKFYASNHVFSIQSDSQATHQLLVRFSYRSLLLVMRYMLDTLNSLKSNYRMQKCFLLKPLTISDFMFIRLHTATMEKNAEKGIRCTTTCAVLLSSSGSDGVIQTMPSRCYTMGMLATLSQTATFHF